jgi:DNA-directed RNA polymerase subunit RPC12/RpoP
VLENARRKKMNYPDGFIPKIEKHWVDYRCPKCGKIWEVLYVKDMGFDEPYDSDHIYCPECGQEGEVA